MEQQLLAMLNSSSSKPAALPSPGNPRSPKEATPPPPLPAFSPPPAQVSIQDLFKSLQSPPVTSPPPTNQGQHQDRLLNMLKGLGQPSDTPGPSTPGQTLKNGDKPMNDHSRGLLDMFNRPSEPTVQHAKSPEPQTQPPPPPISQPPPPQPQAESKEAATSTPQKSIFDFVSPFDAFDKPQTPKEATKPKPKASPAPPPKQQPQVPQALSQAAQANSHIKKDRADSPASAADSSKPKKRIEIDFPYKVVTVAGNASGKGARSLSAHTTIDISQPNLEGLCNDEDAVRPIPTTIMRSEYVRFFPGKAVASTPSWMGYSMSRGRIRLIDRMYGARLLLQLPPSASTGPQLDLTHTLTRVASLGCDGTIVVWAIPKSWDQDDVPCPVVTCIAPSQTFGTFSIQWVNKEGSEGLLAIGGTGGVVLVDPAQIGGSTNEPIAFEQAIKGKKVLRPEGTTAAFCLNKAHGALAVISTTSHLTLYSVATQTPVWSRLLPSSSSSPPSSVAFCETQILVGKENNTLLELVQITTEVAVLSSIRFTAPSDKHHFTQPVYDSERCVLWVTNFARCSLYGFHFALRGKGPVTGVACNQVVAFDRLLELPLEPVLSLTLNDRKDGVAAEDALLHIYYSTPAGVGDAFVERTVLAGLLDGEGVAPLTEEKKEPVMAAKEKEKLVEKPARVASPAQAPRASSPVQQSAPAPVSAPALASAAASVPPPTPKADKPKEVKIAEPIGEKKTVVKTEVIEPVSAPAPVSTPASGSDLSAEILNKALKKTEDGLSNKLKQLVTKEIATLSTRIESSQQAESSAAVERQNVLVAKITAEVERSLKVTVAGAVRDEIKSIIPTLETITRDEVRDAVGKSSAAQIATSMQTLPKEIEKLLTPTLARTFSQTLHPIVERSVHDMVAKTLVPSYTQITTQMYDQLSRDIRSEMLDIRKEIVSEQSDELASTKSLVLTMASSLAALTSQVQALSEQLARQPPAFAPPPPHLAVPPPPPHHAPPLHVAPPPAPVPLKPEAVEEVFLAALSSPEQPRAIMELIRGQWGATDMLLPRAGASPLSQAVLLSLLHRLGTVLAEAPPLEDGFNMALAWAHRVARLIDPKDVDTSTYVGRVLPTVQTLLRTATLNLGQRGGEQGARALGAIQQINNVLSEKLIG